MPALIGPIGSVVNMNQAVNGNAAGNPVYISQLNVAESAALGGIAALIASYNSQLASSASAALATTVLNNMFVTTAAGVPAANVTALTTALTQAFDTYPTAKGQVISNLSTLLGNLESDANWGPAARAFNNQTAANYTYSTNAANTNSGTPSSSTATAFTLTTGVDAVGTAYTSATGTVTGTAASTTLNVFDTINMSSSGTANTITANFANTDINTINGTVLPTLNGVQILNFQNSNNTGGNTADLSVAPNLTTFNLVTALTGGLLTASGANANMRTIGLNGTTASDVDLTVQYVAGALAGSSDALTLNLAGQLTAVTANAAISTDLIVSGGSVGAGFETVNLNVASASRLGVLTVNDSGGANTMTTLNISGAGAFRDYSQLVFKTGVTGVINASTNTGGVTVIVGTQDISMTGGTGSDSITFLAAGDYNANDTVRLGSGTNDVIVLADTAINNTTSALNALITASEAETVGFSAAATVDMDFLTQTSISVNSTTDVALTVQKLAATDTLTINTGTNAAADVNATGSLGFTTANIVLAGTATGRVNMDNLDVTGNAVVNITSNGSNTVTNTLDNLNLSANANVTITGTQSLTITNALDNTSVVINASGLSGTALLTVTAGTAASSLVGGLNNDVLTGGSNADTIVGGAGSDTINSGDDTTAAGSSITGGLGADTINLQNTTTNSITYGVNVTAAESYATAGQFDTINSADLGGAGDSNIITLTTGVLSSTVTAATSVNIGVTAVTAGAYLVIAPTAVLTATDQNISVYQDSNSNGIIDATDLRVDFTAAGTDTTAVTITGGKLVVTQLHA